MFQKLSWSINRLRHTKILLYDRSEGVLAKHSRGIQVNNYYFHFLNFVFIVLFFGFCRVAFLNEIYNINKENKPSIKF